MKWRDNNNTQKMIFAVLILCDTYFSNERSDLPFRYTDNVSDSFHRSRLLQLLHETAATGSLGARLPKCLYDARSQTQRAEGVYASLGYNN